MVIYLYSLTSEYFTYHTVGELYLHDLIATLISEGDCVVQFAFRTDTDCWDVHFLNAHAICVVIQSCVLIQSLQWELHHLAEPRILKE